MQDKAQLIIERTPKFRRYARALTGDAALADDLGVGIWAGHYSYNPPLVECGAAEDSV